MYEIDGRLLNAEPSPDDPRDFPFVGNTASGLPAPVIPRRFRNSGLGPVLDQHATGTCGGQTGIGLRQWQEQREGHPLATEPGSGTVTVVVQRATVAYS